MTQSFVDWFLRKNKTIFDDSFDSCEDAWNAGAASRQAEIDELKWMLKNSNGQADEFCKKSNELQKSIDVCEKLRDSQFDKLWSLTQAIEVARVDADEDFDLFLNCLSNILKGKQDD